MNEFISLKLILNKYIVCRPITINNLIYSIFINTWIKRFTFNHFWLTIFSYPNWNIPLNLLAQDILESSLKISFSQIVSLSLPLIV